MDKPVTGAERIAFEVQEVETRLRDTIALMVDLLDPKRKKRDSARLTRAINDTNHLVHAGFRLVAISGQAKAADLQAAGADDAARGRVQAAWTPVGRSIHELQVTLAKWPVINSMVRPQVIRRRRALFEDIASLPDIVRTREAVNDKLFAELHGMLTLSQQASGAYDHGCFPDIPLAQSLFQKEAHAAARILRAMRPGEMSRFLDVGCGIGLKVMSAAMYFDRAVGLEYDSGYAQGAEKFLRRLDHDRCRVIQGDALTFERYHDYDVIYFFRPIRHDKVLRVMEEHILATARPRTILIAPYRIFEERAPDYDCAHVAGHIYITRVTPKEAARLKREAEHIGPDVPLRPDANVPLLWDALIRVSRQNGFEPSLTARAAQ